VRIVFLGSGRFAIPSLEALLEAGHDVVAVVTQPDREKGRGQQLAPPPVKPVAGGRGLRVLQPRRVREPEAVAALEELRPDLQVVVAYGQILPRRVIDIAPRGTVNVHASLLPRYRGAAPIQWAIARGETTTGVTTMLIDEGLDTGPILLAREAPIGPDETAAELEPRLAALGGQLLVETVAGLADGRLQPTPQDHAKATLAPLLKKEDGTLDWSLSAHEIACRVRGFHPWPGCFTTIGGRVLKVLRAQACTVPEAPGEAPGTILEVGGAGVAVRCGGATALRLLEVQPESRRAMAAQAFASGARLLPGQRFS
jgi:methionyl-tRNA formyltransferase